MSSIMQHHSTLPVPLNVYDSHEALLATPQDNQKSAGLPVANSTRSYWLHPSSEVNPLAKEGSEGLLTGHADVCIIGSGITGVSAAYNFAKALQIDGNGPLSVVILEARDFCSGATGRNGGHLTPAAFLDFEMRLNSSGAKEALKQYALEHHSVQEILSIIKDNDLQKVTDLVSGGHYDLIFTDEELASAKSDFELARDAGADLSYVQWFSESEMAKNFGTKYNAVKILGHNLWPMKLVTQFYYLAQKMFSEKTGSSLDLHTNTPVTSISPSSEGKRRWTLHTPRGPVSCSSVLHATNGYASHLLPFLTGSEGITPVRGQIIATRADVPTDVLSISSWSGNEGFEYWFPRPVNNSFADKPLIILGGGREIEKNFELYETDDSVINGKASAVLRAFLPAVFPGKFEKGREPEMEWTGIMGFTRIHDPFVGPVIDPNDLTSKSHTGQYISAGYTGHGMPRTYACAEAVVSLIMHEMKGESRESWKRPDWLPARYLTWIRDSNE